MTATTADRIAELTAAWEEGANYGETEPTHRAADYVLSEDDWAAYLSNEEAAEIVALIERQDRDLERAEKIAAETLGDWLTTISDHRTVLQMLTAAALQALTETENAR